MSMNSFHARQGRPRDETAEKKPVDRHGLLRADALLLAQGLASSRTVAQAMIKAGRVSWQGGLISKPALALPADTPLRVKTEAGAEYVSRGGHQLTGALAASGLVVAGQDCLDGGQSTGGTPK